MDLGIDGKIALVTAGTKGIGLGIDRLRDVPGVEELVPYEAQVNRFAIRYPQVLLCLYDLDQFSGDIILGVLKTHPKVLAGGTVVANPHYIHPDQFLAAAQ